MSLTSRMSLSRHDEPVTPPEGGTKPVEKPVEKPADEFKAITSQADFDAMVAHRLARQKAQFGDYEDLKAKAALHDAAEAKNLTELEKEKVARTAAEARATASDDKAAKAAVRAAVIDAARVAGAVDPADVLALLAADAVTIDKDGNVTGATEAVTALLAAKPHLKGAAKIAGSIDQGGQGGKPVDFRNASKEVYEAEMARIGARLR